MNNKYALPILLFFFVIAAFLNSCAQPSIHDYLPMPANRTQPPVIEKVSLVDKKLVVTWSAVEGANKYNVYYGLKPGVSAEANDGSIPAREPSALVESPKEYTNYYFMVTSFNSKGLESEPSDEYKYTAPQPPAPTPTQPGTPVGDCKLAHTMPGRTVDWVFTQCNPVTGVLIQPSTTGEDGTAIGSRSFAVGRLSFSVRGATNAQYTPKYTLVFVVLMRAFGNSGREANWHWLSFGREADIESRVVVQRFDGTCPNFCEKSSQDWTISFDNPTDSWTWDCAWDTENVTCNVHKNGVAFAKLTTPTLGPYYSLDFLGIGDQSVKSYETLGGFYSNIRLTVFR